MEQVYNENKQGNTVRNLLIILLIVVLGTGSFMIYNTAYKTSSPNTTQNNKEKPAEISGKGILYKMEAWLSNTYHSTTQEARILVNTVGAALVIRYILWPTYKLKRRNRVLKKERMATNKKREEAKLAQMQKQ